MEISAHARLYRNSEGLQVLYSKRLNMYCNILKRSLQATMYKIRLEYT